MFGSLGIWEILLILLVVALLFGGRKLPDLGRGLGEGIKNFRDSLSRKDHQDKEGKNTNAKDD
ncbi:MAG: twin-arginine translocase TatA/TatE family subunit [Acidobacteriota bacterium]|jgi:sec-independent protein translocase protein TatA|nr:twin-arginine translocase TatA/TatE family subunit [Acidobacteriota bacterium]